MKRLWLACALVLASCTAPAPKVVTRVQVEKLTIPAPLLVAPAPPVPPTVNNAEAVSAWIARLWADDLNKTDQIAAISKIVK